MNNLGYASTVVVVVLLLLIGVIERQSVECLSTKYRRWCAPWKFCSLTNWHPWKPCDKSCGGGMRTRYRQMCSLPVMDFTQHAATCGRSSVDFIEQENCSQICSSYGKWSNETSRCVCDDESITDSCCATDLGRWSPWSPWSGCLARCGTYGVRNRTRMCEWKVDLVHRDFNRTKCTGDRYQFDSCLKDCHEAEYDNEFFDKMPSNISVSIGKHAQFVCKQKTGSIKWFVNDQDVTLLATQNPSIKVISNATTLFIYPVTTYFLPQTRITCQINMPDSERINRYAWMSINSDSDKLDNSIDNQCSLVQPIESVYYVRLGTSFSIQCQAKTPNATVIWHKNGAIIIGNGQENMQILIEYMLFINTVDISHNASFSCTVQTTSKCKQTSYWTLIVFERTQRVFDTLQPNPLNFVGSHGIVLPGSSPWHVTISYRDSSAHFVYDAFCSGLLVDEDTVLSVSQCFDTSSSLRTFLEQQQLLFDPTKLVAYVAKYDRLSTSPFERQSSISQLITSNNDFVILKVHLLFLSTESRPLPLATMADLSSLMSDMSLYATGWGPLSTNADKPMRLKYVQQRLIDCHASSSPITLCTTAVAVKQPNLCPGDAGGVVFVQTKQRIFAVGLVARFSKTFCDTRSTQITTIVRLDIISNWMKQHSLA